MGNGAHNFVYGTSSFFWHSNLRGIDEFLIPQKYGALSFYAKKLWGIEFFMHKINTAKIVFLYEKITDTTKND